MSARPQLRPLTGVSHGRPAAGDLRGLAAILLRLDQQPLRLVQLSSDRPSSAHANEALQSTPR